MTVQVTADEADKKRQELLDRWRRGDPTADLTAIVGGDPNFRYRGINKHPNRIARAKALGFENLPPEDKAHFPVQMGASGKEFGDIVLMREPMDLYQAKLERNRRKREARDEARGQAIDEEINRIARDGKAVGPHQTAVTEN